MQGQHVEWAVSGKHGRIFGKKELWPKWVITQQFSGESEENKKVIFFNFYGLLGPKANRDALDK
jgi:hypothetical protein